MKKIIYSFVIMIAAGSLFTSCVENTEPQGIKDIRQAKADYIESLSKLNAANEKLVAAEAAYKEAETAVKNAEVAVVEAQAAQAQALAAQEQARVEIIKAQAEAAKIANEKAVAALNHQLALDSLALVEKLIEMAQSEQINALFIEAQKAELAKQLAMDSARIMQMFLEIAEQQEIYAYNAELRKADLEEYKAMVEKNIKGYEADIARFEADIRDAQDRIAKAEAQAQKDALDLEKELLYKQAALIKAQQALAEQEAAYLAYLAKVELQSYTLTKEEQAAVKKYKDAYTAVIAAKQKVRKVEELIFKNDSTIENKYATKLRNLKNAVIWDSTAVEFYKEQIADVEARLASLPDSGKTAAEVAALEAEYAEQLDNLEYEQSQLDLGYNTYLTGLGEPISGFATELGDWVAKYAALPAPFDMHFKAELPDNGAVSDLFVDNVREITGVDAGKNDQTGKKYIVANFQTSSDAFKGVEAIDSIIDAISRKYIIDKVGNADYDTVGLAAAVKAAQDEYDAIADTLDKGLVNYKYFVAAQDSVKKAITDTTNAFAAYRKAYTADTTARNEWWEARFAYRDAKDTLGKYMAEDGPWDKAKNDSIQWGMWHKLATINLEQAVKDTAAAYLYLDTLVGLDDKIAEAAGKAREDSLKLESAKITKAAADQVVADVQAELINAAAAQPIDNKKVDSLNTVLKEKQALAKAAADKVNDCKKAVEESTSKLEKLKEYSIDYNAKLAAAKEAYKNAVEAYKTADKNEKTAKAKLDTAATNYLAAVKDTLDLTEAFNAAVADSVAKRGVRLKADTLLKVAILDSNAAFEFYERATGEILPAAKGKFYSLYGGFWGVEITDASFNEDGFLNDSIKIAPKEFVDIFTKDGAKDIVKFNPTYKYNHNNDPKFFGNPALVNNKEIVIIKDQLADHNVTDFDATLLCDLFAKQQAAEEIFAAVGTVDNDKALAALTKIKEDLADAFVAAGKKQEAYSEPFFKFVQNLVGEEFLNSVFARIDKAIAVYSEFNDEKVNPSTMDIIAKAVAQGKTTSKQVFTYWVEDQLCNHASPAYHAVYASLQIADAFAGEELRQLLSDFIACVIKAADLEDSVELVPAETPLKTALNTAARCKKAESSNLLSGAIKLFAPKLAAYLTHDFDGKVAELQKKWFADWSAKADEYADATAEINAKKENINNLSIVLAKYKEDSSIKDLMTKEWFAENILGTLKWNLEVSEYALAEAQKALDAFVAGPDIYEQHKTEHLADVLAKAEDDLAIAEAALERATAAYNKVLESHKVTE